MFCFSFRVICKTRKEASEDTNPASIACSWTSASKTIRKQIQLFMLPKSVLFPYGSPSK